MKTMMSASMHTDVRFGQCLRFVCRPVVIYAYATKLVEMWRKTRIQKEKTPNIINMMRIHEDKQDT